MAKRQKKTIHGSVSLKNEFKENPLYNYGLILFFTVFIFFLSSFKITGDDDVFWHLATGRYIVENHHVPSADVFGFVTQGQTWMPFEWGWDILTYGVYNIGGYTALSVFRSIIFLLIFYILFLILRKFRVSYTLIFLFFTLLSFGIMDRLSPRPHIMSFLFFALLLYIISEYRYFSRKNFKILYFIPLIFLVWANMHMGIIAGIFLLGIYTLSEIIIYLKPDKFSSKEIPSLTKQELYRLIIIFIISLLVMLVNPNSFATYVYAYEHTKMKLLETINEWRSPFDEMFGGGFVTNIYKLFLFGGVLILYYAYKRRDLFAALVFIGFAVYSVRAVRFTVDYLIIITIFLALAVSYIIINSKNEWIKNLFTVNSVPKVIIEVLLLFCIVNIPNDKLYLEYLKYYRVSGFGINSDFIPTQMFDFMKENNIPVTGQRPLNHFGSGGFLIWNFPESKNFIDSRNLNDDIFGEYNTLMSKKPGFEKKLKDYDFDYFIYLAPDLVRAPNEMEQTIISYMSRHPEEWKLVFWDDKSFLFVKNLPKFKEIIDKFEYKYAAPYNFLYQKSVLEKAVTDDPEQLRSELKRKTAQDPNGLIINSINNTYLSKLSK